MPRRTSRQKVPWTTFPTAETLAGQRRQVWNRDAEMTRGGLRKIDLKENKQGKIVSRRVSRLGKKQFKKNGLADDMADEFCRRPRRCRRRRS